MKKRLRDIITGYRIEPAGLGDGDDQFGTAERARRLLTELADSAA